MDRRMVTFGLAAAGTALAGGALAKTRKAAASGGWKTILDGKSLNGWSPIGDGNWSVKDGAVQADMGKPGYLVSKDTYGDFQLRAEVWVDDNTNSGVFIRCTNPLNIDPFTAYEVNLFDHRPDASYGTGAIVDVGKVPVPTVYKAGGRWNVFEIIAKGDRFTVLLNGVKTVDNAQDGKHAHGRIGLQYFTGLVKFRKIQIREL